MGLDLSGNGSSETMYDEGVDVMYVTMGITFITARNLENR